MTTENQAPEGAHAALDTLVRVLDDLLRDGCSSTEGAEVGSAIDTLRATLAAQPVAGFVPLSDYIAKSEAIPERAAALARARDARQAPAEGDSEIPRMLREIGYWDHRGDCVSEACDERYGAGSWDAILAAIAKPQPKGLTVIDPDAWEPCSPAWLQAGGCCATAPRLWHAATNNHWHPKAQAPAPVPEPTTGATATRLIGDVAYEFGHFPPDQTDRLHAAFVVTLDRWHALRPPVGNPSPAVAPELTPAQKDRYRFSSNVAERIKYEAWQAAEGHPVRLEGDGTYSGHLTADHDWYVWQAATGSRVPVQGSQP